MAKQLWCVVDKETGEIVSYDCRCLIKDEFIYCSLAIVNNRKYARILKNDLTECRKDLKKRYVVRKVKGNIKYE